MTFLPYHPLQNLYPHSQFPDSASGCNYILHISQKANIIVTSLRKLYKQSAFCKIQDALNILNCSKLGVKGKIPARHARIIFLHIPTAMLSMFNLYSDTFYHMKTILISFASEIFRR